MITTFLARLTPACKDISRLVSESMDRRLPFITRVKLRLHLMICEGCERYAEQLRAIRGSLRRLAENGVGAKVSSAPQLSEEARVELKRTLKSQEP